MYKVIFAILLSTFTYGQIENIPLKLKPGDYRLPNLVPALDYEDDLKFKTGASNYIPVKDIPFIEHIRVPVKKSEMENLKEIFTDSAEEDHITEYQEKIGITITGIVTKNDRILIGTVEGLVSADRVTGDIEFHKSYGVNGPLSTVINDIAIDSRNNIWITTPIGLSRLSSEGKWSAIRGTEGLPVEKLTKISVDKNDDIWLGTEEGAVLYKPYKNGRQWYYRAGKRYLIDDNISDVAVSRDGKSIFFATDKGISKIAAVERPLFEKVLCSLLSFSVEL
jgi:hypothetical protein